MKMNQISGFFYDRILKSKTSKVFLVFSLISLVLSFLNKTKLPIIGFELFIYITLTMTANCLIYGGCQVSAFLILLAPLSLIMINILEFTGLKVKTNLTKYNLKKYTDPSFLGKSEEEKEKQIQDMETNLYGLIYTEDKTEDKTEDSDKNN
tara:strand:+ start:2504 stop:2956 length:453 start_codon:yes stop_codon:yes gene_type:complete